MKVLQVIPSIAARYGGPSEAMIQLCRSLLTQGATVGLACTTAEGEEDEFGATARAMCGPSFHVLQVPRLASEKFKFAPRFSRWIGERAGDYDVIHIHAVFAHTSLSAAHAARVHRRPYILRPLGNLSSFSLRKSPIRKKLYLTVAGGDLIRGSAAIHCTSQDEESDLRNTFQVTRTFVIPNGVDERIFEIPEDRREKIVLYLGRLDPRKNISALIEAFARVNDPEWRLVIAGAGEAERELRTVAGLSDARIEFAGWVDGRRKLQLLGQASLFASPSSYENFGISVAEAMAAALPVIVSPGVALARTVDETRSGWVADENQESLAAVLRTAMNDPALVRERGENARRAAACRYRWSRIGEKLMSKYEQLSSAM